MTKTTFSLEYFLSVLITLIVVVLIQKSSPNTNFIIKLLAGLVTAFISLWLMNTLFPKINKVGTAIYDYSRDSISSNVNNTGYAQVFPPFLAIFTIFLICLYSKVL